MKNLKKSYKNGSKVTDLEINRKIRHQNDWWNLIERNLYENNQSKNQKVTILNDSVNQDIDTRFESIRCFQTLPVG